MATAPIPTVPYLRVVVTTACPLRCPFCHMEGDPASARPLPASTLASIVAAGVANGVRKIKLLGGEPLARADLPEVVASIRAVAPVADLSLITSGVAPVARLDACFDAGLDRANLSIHGWELPAFVTRGGSARSLALRTACLDRLLDRGRPLKLNYVYGSEADREDLAGLLDWAAGRPLVVNVLDDLHRPELTPDAIRAAVVDLRGVPKRSWEHPDPDGLPTLHLGWPDGLEVEIKHQRLGVVAPWYACSGCANRTRCREGIHAVRVTHEGVLRQCMDRPDLGVPLLPALAAGGGRAVSAAWRCFLAGAAA